MNDVMEIVKEMVSRIDELNDDAVSDSSRAGAFNYYAAKLQMALVLDNIQGIEIPLMIHISKTTRAAHVPTIKREEANLLLSDVAMAFAELRLARR